MGSQPLTKAQAKRLGRILDLWARSTMVAWEVEQVGNRLKLAVTDEQRGRLTWDIGPRGGDR